MTETRHTPGPWEAFSADDKGDLYIGDAAGYLIIAEHVDDVNAALIAAAPDLLAECAAVLEGWEARTRGHGDKLNPWEEERMSYLRDAIAKARGGA